MTSKSKFLKLATFAIAGATILSSAPALAESKMEKCYGVVKAGKNDCHSAKKGGHSCSGGAKKDGDKSEWVFVPSGVCEKLVNGSLKAS